MIFRIKIKATICMLCAEISFLLICNSELAVHTLWICKNLGGWNWCQLLATDFLLILALCLLIYYVLYSCIVYYCTCMIHGHAS
jgi:hypothetical protein